MKCPECGYENLPDANGCEECGADLPKTSAGTSINVGERSNVVGGIQAGNRTEAKALQGDVNVQMPGGGSSGPLDGGGHGDAGNLSIGEKAMVSGGVHTGDKTEMKAGGDINIVEAARDDTKEVRECGVCGETKTQVEGHGACPNCRNWICQRCFNEFQNLCLSCIDQYESIFKAELARVYEDGMIEESEREILRRKAQELRIGAARAEELEAPYADSVLESSEMSSREKRGLARAIGDLEKWDIKDAVRRLDPLFEEHGKKEEEVREWYFRALIELNPERAAQEVEDFKKTLGFDDLALIMAEVELCIRQGNRNRAESLVKRAKKIFRADPARQRRIDIKEIEILLDAYLDEEDKFDLESAEDALEDLEPKDLSDPHECFVRAFFDYASGKKSALDHAQNELTQRSVNTFFVRRKIEYLKDKDAEAQLDEISNDYKEYKEYFEEHADTINYLRQNQAKAKIWNASAHKEDDCGRMMIADCYLHGIGVDKDSQTAVGLLDYLAKTNADPLAQYKLGMLHLDGSDEVPRNEELGFNYLKDAAQRSLPAAQAMTALCYLEAKGVQENFEKAAEMAQISLTSRHMVASYVMGRLCAEGKGIAQDSTRAVQYLNDAANRGYPPAQCLLGEFYAEGACDIIKNETKAAELLTLAVEGEDSRISARAHLTLGNLLASGVDGGTADESKALAHYQKSADLGYPEGQFLYGQILEQGILGVTEDTDSAYDWYGKAAGQGHTKSLVMIGHAFASGTMGKPEDLAEAAKCYTRAAIHGDAEAQFILGELYKFGGVGVSQDLDKSNQWYEKAAENGHKVARGVIGSQLSTATTSLPRHAKVPSQPVSQSAAVSPEEVIMGVLSVNAGIIASWDKVFVHPHIPSDKLQKAMNAVGCPYSEKPYVLFDHTIFGSADEAMLFTDNAVRFKNDMEDEFYAEWNELAQSQLTFNADIIVSHPQAGIKKIACEYSTCDADWGVVIEMIKQISSGIAES